jgi:hypothetical protein
VREQLQSSIISSSSSSSSSSYISSKPNVSAKSKSSMSKSLFLPLRDFPLRPRRFRGPDMPNIISNISSISSKGMSISMSKSHGNSSLFSDAGSIIRLYAALIFWNNSVVSLPPRFLSGWYFKAKRLYACRTSSVDAPFSNSNAL